MGLIYPSSELDMGCEILPGCLLFHFILLFCWSVTVIKIDYYFIMAQVLTCAKEALVFYLFPVQLLELKEN